MSEKITLKSKYAYGILEPITHTYTKDGRLVIGTSKSIHDHIKKNPKLYHYTKLQLALPPICIALGIITLSFIVFV